MLQNKEIFGRNYFRKRPDRLSKPYDNLADILIYTKMTNINIS